MSAGNASQSEGSTSSSSQNLRSVKDLRVYTWRIRITALLLITGFALAILSAPRLQINGFADQAFDIAGYLALMAGISLRIWSVAAISTRKTIILVSTGPYALCRNPLYVGTLLIVIGFLALVQSATMTILTIPIIFLYIWGVVPAEERVLLQHHGDAYREYCASTSRWLPRLSSWKRLGIEPAWSGSLRREIECSVWWIAIAILVHVSCDLRMTSWWHPLFYCP
jgi:protein-S-isoprenylcysteine O-methyltransferase Ste14